MKRQVQRVEFLLQKRTHRRQNLRAQTQHQQARRGVRLHLRRHGQISR